MCWWLDEMRLMDSSCVAELGDNRPNAWLTRTDVK
jgi:hypothetical protein